MAAPSLEGVIGGWPTSTVCRARLGGVRQAAVVTVDPAPMRRDYALAGLSEDDLAPTWAEQFGRNSAEH